MFLPHCLCRVGKHSEFKSAGGPDPIRDDRPRTVYETVSSCLGGEAMDPNFTGEVSHKST